MTDPLSPSSAEFDDLAPAALQKEMRSLRTLLHVTLVALIVLSGSLSVVLLRQVIGMRRQIRELTTVVLTYEKNEVPVLEDFRKRLDEFARRNPDFRPILSKYFQPDTNAAAVAPVVAPPANRPAPVAPRK